MESPSLRLAVRYEADGATLAAIGEIDLATAPGLESEALRLLADCTSALILDLAGVSFCDSQGISTLVRIDRHAREIGARFTIVRARPVIARVMRITGADKVLDVAEGS